MSELHLEGIASKIRLVLVKNYPDNELTASLTTEKVHSLILVANQFDLITFSGVFQYLCLWIEYPKLRDKTLDVSIKEILEWQGIPESEKLTQLESKLSE